MKNASSGPNGFEAGEAWSDSLGLRFKRPHDAAPKENWFYAASPWIDGDLLYVRTGGLDRFGFTAGGLAHNLSEADVEFLSTPFFSPDGVVPG